jgi:hypothetical protein
MGIQVLPDKSPKRTRYFIGAAHRGQESLGSKRRSAMEKSAFDEADSARSDCLDSASAVEIAG